MGEVPTALALVSCKAPRSERRRVLKYPGVFKKLCKRASENDQILHSLDLRGFQLGEDGAFDLAQSLRANTNLRELNLWINHIGDDGVVALSEVLQRNSTVTRLDLFNNDIGDTGACAVADLLVRNSAITYLSLHTNAITGAGATALAEALRENNSLRTLVLSGNKIDDEGVMALAEALEHNSTLTELVLEDNKSTDADLLQGLDELLKENQTALLGHHTEKKLLKELQDESHEIHSLTQHQDLATLADCAFRHTDIILDLVDQTPSRHDKEPAISHVRSPVASQVTLCDVEARVLHSSSPVNLHKG